MQWKGLGTYLELLSRWVIFFFFLSSEQKKHSLSLVMSLWSRKKSAPEFEEEEDINKAINDRLFALLNVIKNIHLMGKLSKRSRSMVLEKMKSIPKEYRNKVFDRLQIYLPVELCTLALSLPWRAGFLGCVFAPASYLTHKNLQSCTACKCAVFSVFFTYVLHMHGAVARLPTN